MPRRVESPSSINTYKQCARKYYYQYIRKFPTSPNIHTIRGNIVHSALEKFFEVDPATIDPLKYRPELAAYLSNLFDALWRKNKTMLERLAFSPDQERIFYEESRMMLGNWLNAFFDKVKRHSLDKPFIDAFNQLKPIELEAEYKSDQHSVRGFIDVIENENGIIKLVDYKTSKSTDAITKEYRLQLAIYALLYKTKHGRLPDKVSIWFLKNSEITLDVDESLVKDAEFEIEQIHFSTGSEHITDYPCSMTPLCKWSTGQCDFYDICVKDRHK